MPIFQTKKDVDNLTELRKRKAELKAQLEKEKAELQATVLLVREDMKPANFIKHAVTGFLGIDQKSDQTEDSNAKPGLGWGLPLQLLADALIPNRRIANLIKTLGPAALIYAPKLAKKAGDAIPSKAAIYGTMRSKIAGLRSKLKKKNESPDLPEDDSHIFI